VGETVSSHVMPSSGVDPSHPLRCNLLLNLADACENLTNEATVVDGFGMNEPTLAADVGLESPTYMKAIEQNATIEPALAALGDGGVDAENTAGMNGTSVANPRNGPRSEPHAPGRERGEQMQRRQSAIRPSR
jgi:hypothetical protein